MKRKATNGEAGFDEEAGFRFSAGATIGFVVRADEDLVKTESFAKQFVHAVEFAA